MKKLSVQDVDRCVNEKQNSDSGEMQKTAPCHSTVVVSGDITESVTGVKELDPGHIYQLPSYDGGSPQLLVFMKREGEGYPFNVGHHPGTNNQSVYRASIMRHQYLQSQEACDENAIIIRKLRENIWHLEIRAAQRHGRTLPKFPLTEIELQPTCAGCGHIGCMGNHKAQDTESAEGGNNPDDTVAGSWPHPSESEFRVSEAAPERIWIDPSAPEPMYFKERYEPLAEHLVEYARVHQPPEQNLEDKNSGEMQTKASSHSSSRIPKDISLTLAEIRKDLERGARPWYNTDIRALLSIIDTLQRGDGFVSQNEESHGQASPPKSSESESTLVTVDALRLAEKIAAFEAGHCLTSCPEHWTKSVTEIIAVHQPDVQTADVLRKAAESARYFIEAISKDIFYVYSPEAAEQVSHHAEEVLKQLTNALAASPVQPEVSKEQDNAKS